MGKVVVSSLFNKSSSARKLGEAIANSQKQTQISGLVGSSYTLVISEVFKHAEKPFLIVLNNKEEAAYHLNDLENLLGEKNVLFYPGSYRRPYQIEETDNANVLLRAEVLNRINSRKKPAIIVSYPEALFEKVVTRKELEKHTLKISVGDDLSIDFVNEVLFEYHFKRTDFVTEPGEFSVRGGILDVFSFSNDMPYRLEFFGDDVESIRSFEDLLHKHGTGRGCDICKPTAGSILASLWNDYVLDDQHVGLQDTNDTFLANMQNNGTYSVVPRIAGGEITPDKLIVLGQVAKKYQLYTKITGGQRIDLFGARVQHLPAIWQELIEAGFETGHAYGKALRTVKSCVGSTWCRYGVQDSVAMALYVENRYKGLRSPHKLKSGVSGCTRECAEAQSKDFGIIATENGWNLYVGGNGGMKPRHAELFAIDLDDQTLIKYIDRFLMFYVRTADRLQRTSVWMGNLEGGLDYLKQVIIEDSLGICNDLEAQMDAVVGSYQCEWKTTIEDPEKLKRFRQFVNSEAEDRAIVFVEERGQPRPATEAERQQMLTTPA